MNPIKYVGAKPIDTAFFYNELNAVGLANNLFSFGADGSFEFHPSMDQAVIDAILVVYDAHGEGA